MRAVWVLSPIRVLWLAVACTAAAWILPGEHAALRGFGVREPVEFGGIIVLVVWYLALTLALAGGIQVGRGWRMPRLIGRADRAPGFDSTVLTVVTLMAAAGVIASYAAVLQSTSVTAVFQSRIGNELAAQLNRDAGMETLRYAAILSAAIGCHLWITHRRHLLLACLNIGLLFLQALLSSRLSLVFAAFILLFLHFRGRERAVISRKQLSILGAVAFGLLTALNYVRNANFYESYGVFNPLMMNLYQIVSYLGAPFQVSLGIANGIFNGTNVETGEGVSSLAVLTPSFLLPNFSQGAGLQGSERYGYVVDVSGNFTANGVFADTYVAYGVWGLGYAILAIFAAGVIFGHFSQYRSVLAAGAGVALYVVAEYWRTLMLTQGIVLFVLGLLVAASLMSAAIWNSTRHKVDA